MARSAPGRIRASVPRRRVQETRPVIDGLSTGALSEIARLERTRNALQPGDVAAAVGRWRDYVRTPERQLWHERDWGNVHWYCCGNPLEARALLDTVLYALSARGARELRRVISRSDALWKLPWPPGRDD